MEEWKLFPVRMPELDDKSGLALTFRSPSQRQKNNIYIENHINAYQIKCHEIWDRKISIPILVFKKEYLNLLIKQACTGYLIAIIPNPWRLSWTSITWLLKRWWWHQIPSWKHRCYKSLTMIVFLLYFLSNSDEKDRNKNFSHLTRALPIKWSAQKQLTNIATCSTTTIIQKEYKYATSLKTKNM